MYTPVYIHLYCCILYIDAMDFLRGSSVKSWNDAENISMAPAQGRVKRRRPRESYENNVSRYTRLY